jgi:hypothetical protein
LEYNDQVTTLVLGEKVFLVDYGIIQCFPNLSKLIIKSQKLQLEQFAFSKSNIQEVFFDADVYITELPKNLFDCCYKLRKVILPISINSINDSCFLGCKSLSNIVLPESLEIIGHNAFESCSSLTCLSIPNKVKEIGVQAFKDCTQLLEINISKNVIFLGFECFFRCENLKKATVQSNINLLKEGTFAYCKNLFDIVLNSEIKKLDNRTFYGCESLTNLTNANFSHIGDYCFYNCKSLKSITTANISYIGNHAFEKCQHLESIKFNPNDESGIILDYLENEGITIGVSAFSKCCNIEKLFLPKFKCIIQKNAFDNCKALKEIYIGEEYIDDNTMLQNIFGNNVDFSIFHPSN